MARKLRDLDHLARELASLTPEERARVFAHATPAVEFRPLPKDWSPPLLTGGTAWIGGPLRRDELYGDDGR